MTAWNVRSRACFAEPPAESPSTRKSSERAGSWLVQSASLPGNAGPATVRLRVTRCAALRRACAFSMAYCAIALARVRMLVEPQRSAVARVAFDERRRFARPETLLGLASELRVLHLERQHEARVIPHVLRRELHAARHETATIREVAHRGRHAGTQTVDVRAAATRGNEVHVALGDRQRDVRRPGERPGHGRVSLALLAGQRLGRQPVFLVQLFEQGRRRGRRCRTIRPSRRLPR